MVNDVSRPQKGRLTLFLAVKTGLARIQYHYIKCSHRVPAGFSCFRLVKKDNILDIHRFVFCRLLQYFCTFARTFYWEAYVFRH